MNDILVIGGGIGGLAAALGTSNIGRKVAVLERAPEFGEIGAGFN
ncbi:FAD-dependent oxidoreductase [Terrilactibacillus sp. S3-3]|nr:FAD-dependent oxidoreductase [Terrilactibacillus sp. S3-3]